MIRELLYKTNEFHEKIAQEFANRYYCPNDEEKFEGVITCQEGDKEGTMHFWYAINDDMWNIDDMYTALWYGIPYAVLFAWFDIKSGNVGGDNKINLMNFYRTSNSFRE